MTDIAITHPVERIARVLCAQDYSEKGEGLGSGRGAAISAAVSSHCDHGWREEIVRAAEVLRTLREPTEDMVKAGEAAGGGAADVWNAMVRSALGEAE
ncbi:hypothetical protein [Stakelama pacifica]|uniref:Uncharacterized protein n=1 Tax=Stakelama pacifica TaxID=517720 RepID=A0A4R6FIA9_9SPHN|nr:hypothetical protein [Stakelama pacifica]MAX00047.1 hypothetical protein [Sphingomonas sp.]TDN80224.1 hypothetical protein EV664_11016 [Stakelama pacifica]GGO97697.1 hypothetical protein GCM10011329_27140 [Stakelama pacifica]